MVAFRITSAYLLAIVFDLGVFGVYLAMGIDWVYRMIVQMNRLKSGRWKASFLV